MLVAAKGKTLTLFWKNDTMGVKVAKKITLEELEKTFCVTICDLIMVNNVNILPVTATEWAVPMSMCTIFSLLRGADWTGA